MKKTLLNKKNTEIINSLGPFNHSNWIAQGIKITNEENLAGRADFLVTKIRKIITKKFSKVNLKTMTIIDVGCYDGWVLHKLSDLPFDQMVGIEPREKNIIKGKKIRKILGIKSRIKIKKGEINNLGKKKYDVVLCNGLLNHLESLSTALKDLNLVCKKMLIITCVVLPSRHITKELRNDLELKDVIYQSKDSLCGITGQKYESAYYDGSTDKTTIVSVPTIESILMNLDILGFNTIKIAAAPKEIKRKLPHNHRPHQEVIVYATKNSIRNKNSIQKYLEIYEKGLIENVIPEKYIIPLFDRYCLKKKKINTINITKKIFSYIDKHEDGCLDFFTNKHQHEIIKNLRFNPKEKIALEFAKILYSKKKYKESVQILESIVQKINADWRCVYRSFFLLSKIYRNIGNNKKSKYYYNLCKSCNPNFPLKI